MKNKDCLIPLKKILIIGVLLLSGMTTLHAQKIETGLDTNAILIGDQTQYTITVETEEGNNVIFPLFRDTLTRGIEIIESHGIDTHQQEETPVKYTKAYTITAFDSGHYPIPARNIILNQEDTFQTPTLDLKVYTVPVDTTQAIKAIKAPLGVPVAFREILPYLLIILGLGIIATFIYFYRKYRKQNKPVFNFKKPEPPAHIAALEALDQLAEEKLWQKSEVKAYYSRLTNIIRGYMEKRFAVRAMEETTGEILEDFESILRKPEFQQIRMNQTALMAKLKELLQLADMVKFARGEALPDENKKHLDNAYDFVLQTKKDALSDQQPEKEEAQ